MNLFSTFSTFKLFPFSISKEFDIKIIDWLKRVDKEKFLLETTIKRTKALGYGYTINGIKNVKLIENKI